MRRTSELWELAEREGIQVVWEPLRPGRVGLYLPRPRSNPVIVLDPWLERRERWLRAALAHELGHHFTTTGGWLRLAAGEPAIGRACEAAARRWALDFLLPNEEFLPFWRRYPNVQEAADHFYVPESFVVDKLGQVRSIERMAA